MQEVRKKEEVWLTPDFLASTTEGGQSKDSLLFFVYFFVSVAENTRITTGKEE